MHNKETQFLKCNGRASIKTQLRFEFLASQKAFDKKLRHYERVYKQSVCDDIENMSTEKPNVSWEKLSKHTMLKQRPSYVRHQR